MRVPVAVWQPCEHCYTLVTYLRTYAMSTLTSQRRTVTSRHARYDDIDVYLTSTDVTADVITRTFRIAKRLQVPRASQ